MLSRLSSIFILLLAVFALVDAGCAYPQQPLIDVTPATETLVSGQSVQLTVTRRFPGGAVDDVTSRVVYNSSNRQVAIVGERGLVTAGNQPGSVLVRVVDPTSDATAAVTFTVISPRIESIEIDPSPAVVMRPGTTRRFVAKARLSNGVERDVTNEVQWASSNEAAASVGRTPADIGVVTAISEGDTTISATDAATLVQARSIVFVRGEAAELKAIVVTPNPALIPVGQTQKLVALGVFSDGSTVDIGNGVTWSSSRTDVATVDATGLVTGVAAGDATITASGLGPPADVKGSAAAKVQ